MALGGEDLRQALHEGAHRAGPAAALDLGLQDLRAALDQSAKQGEVLPLCQALVPAAPQIVQGHRSKAVRVLRMKDAIDPAATALDCHPYSIGRGARRL